jgi:hypothetical protein
MKKFVLPLEATMAVLLAACAPQLHVPEGIVGDVPVKLVNDTSDTLCEIKLTADGENIVRGGGFSSHKNAMIKLKPGAYAIYATSVGCGGSLTGTRQIVVQQATEVHIGGTVAATPAGGFVTANIAMGGQAVEQTCQAKGFGCALDSDCCTGLRCVESSHSCL